MDVYKDKYKTKDRKQWFFKIRYTDIDGSPAQKKSGRFATKKEAGAEEFTFKMGINTKENLSILLLKKWWTYL